MVCGSPCFGNVDIFISDSNRGKHKMGPTEEAFSLISYLGEKYQEYIHVAE